MKLDISESVSQSADNLLGLNLVECQQDLLEIAIVKWLEQFIENLPTDIDHFYHHDSSLSKLILSAESQSDNLIDLSETIESDDNHEINFDDYLDDESLVG